MAFFNKELLYSCKDEYVAAMEKLSLPVDEQKIEQWHRTAATAAYARFDKQKFGNEMLSMSGTLRDALQEAVDKEYMYALITRRDSTAHSQLRHDGVSWLGLAQVEENRKRVRVFGHLREARDGLR